MYLFDQIHMLFISVVLHKNTNNMHIHNFMSAMFCCFHVCKHQLHAYSSFPLCLLFSGLLTKPCFTCNVCGHVFHRKDHLERHFARHSGDKPYQCDVCNKRFSRIDNMKTHKFKFHGDTFTTWWTEVCWSTEVCYCALSSQFVWRILAQR